MKRKVTAILLAAAFTMGVFTGCGNAKNEQRAVKARQKRSDRNFNSLQSMALLIIVGKAFWKV